MHVKNGQKGRGLRLAMASFDMRELRVSGNYFTQYGSFSLCRGYQYGRQLLEDLQAGQEYDAILLDDRLRDMDAPEFHRAFSSMDLPRRPILITIDSGVQRKDVAAILQPEENYCIIKPYRLSALAEAIELVCGLQEASLRSFCEELYRAWGLDCTRSGCAYLTDAVGIALDAPGRLAVRKEILLPVSERHSVSVDAVDSGLRRLIREAEGRATPAWRSFRRAHTDETQPLTAQGLLYAIRQAALENNIRDGQEGGPCFHEQDTKRPEGNG